MRPMFVNGMCPGKCWKRIFESWKTLEFGLWKSWKKHFNVCMNPVVMLLSSQLPCHIRHPVQCGFCSAVLRWHSLYCGCMSALLAVDILVFLLQEFVMCCTTTSEYSEMLIFTQGC